MSNEDPAASVSGPSGGPPRKTPRQGIGGSPVGSTLSIVLAVVAVVAGFLILRNITDDNDGASSAIGDGTDVTEDSTTTTVDLALTTTTAVPETTVPPLVTEGATVVVANASGVPGSAGRMSETLALAGFTMAEATNATSQLEVSIVYYDPAVVAAQAVADSVARSMGGIEVATVPTPVPIEGGALNGSGVVVMLGTAQADKTLEEMAGGTATADTTPETGTAPAVAGTETTTTVAG
ncbi:MAG: LytR C-terminal domain-containing protein [Ilumatobacteraceae bacterium]